MKKTYITTMPDHIGAFLKASECFASLGINITRVSYNKAVDSHTLFIDAEGSKSQLEKADIGLTKIGYLQTDKNENSVVLLEFMLRDVPGSVTEVLKLIRRFQLNISYISSQENGSAYQAFKMGLFFDDFSGYRSRPVRCGTKRLPAASRSGRMENLRSTWNGKRIQSVYSAEIKRKAQL